MFYSKKLNLFREQELTFKYPNQPIGYHYIFLEDTDDIVNIHNQTYQYHAEDFNQITILKLARTFEAPELLIRMLVELKKYLKFKEKILSPVSMKSAESDVFMGNADMILMSTTHLVSSITLSPTFHTSNRIWVKDLRFIESKTFFLESFNTNLWLSFLGIFMLFLVISLLLTKFLAFYRKARIDPFDNVSLIMDQGIERVSSIWSYKILLFTLSIMLIIFYCGFEAFLSSLLAVRKVSLPFHDLTSLFTQNEYSLCLTSHEVRELVNYEKHRNTRFKLKIKTDGCLKDMNRINHLKDFDCKIGKVVFITSGRSSGFRRFSRRCNVSHLPEHYIPRQSAILCHPGFKYQEIFNRLFIKMRTAGILQNDFKRSEIRLNLIEPHFSQIDTGTESISFYQVHLIVVILVVGYALSLIILMIERIIRFNATSVFNYIELKCYSTYNANY